MADSIYKEIFQPAVQKVMFARRTKVGTISLSPRRLAHAQ